MKVNVIFLMIGLGVIYVIDLHPALRQKNWKGVVLICILVLAAYGLAASKLAGMPSPIQILHAWLSPLGNIIWKS